MRYHVDSHDGVDWYIVDNYMDYDMSKSYFNMEIAQQECDRLNALEAQYD